MKASKVTIAWSKLAGQAGRIMREETRQHKGTLIWELFQSTLIEHCKMLFTGFCPPGCARYFWPVSLQFCRFSCSFVSKARTGLGNGCEKFTHRDLC